MLVFAVYDSAASYYAPPFCQRSKGEAIRSFTMGAKDPQTVISKHPDQFTLFEIGVYDEQKGEMIPHAAHISLGKAIEFIQ